MSYSKLSGLNINKYDSFVAKLISYIYTKYPLLQKNYFLVVLAHGLKFHPVPSRRYWLVTLHTTDQTDF